jgi:hypothetical protein
MLTCSINSGSMFVHVKCMLATHPCSLMNLTRSMVKVEVEPPAPQVTSMNTGEQFDFILTIR